MSNYTPIIENTQPVTHYNCNDISGTIDNEASPHKFWRFRDIRESANNTFYIKFVELWDDTETGIYDISPGAGVSTSVDVRLFHHDTGGLITQTTSDHTGYYNFTGLYEGVLYDVVAWEEADVTTCQHINMGVLPEQYTY